MHAMTIRELLTYLKSLPKGTVFPVGFGNPFIINNVTDEIVFRPKLNRKSEDMADEIENLLGAEIRSETGARSILHQDSCTAYFGLDSHSTVTPLNIVFLTFMRSMKEATREIIIEFRGTDGVFNPLDTSFLVPAIWWDTLSKRHQDALALEHLTNAVLGGLKFTVGQTVGTSGSGVSLVDAFGYSLTVDNIRLTDAFGQQI